jgi:integrase
MTTIPETTFHEVIRRRLAELDRQRAELLENLRALQAGEVEPVAAEAGRARPKPHNKPRLTKTTAAALPVPNEKNAIYWDKDLSGFGLRISPHGTRTYFLQVRTKAGRGIKVTLGRANRITAEQARDAAKKYLAQVDLGRDPAQELKDKRQAERERHQAPDLDALWEAYAKSPAFAELRPRSRQAYASWWRLHVGPVLGRAKVADLTARDAARLHERLSATVGRSTGNRCHAVLSAVVAYGVRLGLVGANVCRGAVRTNPEPGRERMLDDPELARLLNHLAASPALEARVVEFLLASGGRKGEVLALCWGDLNGDAWWTVPADVSKSGRVVRRPLNQAARDVLARLDRRGDLVFDLSPSRLSSWWQVQRAAIGLAGVRIHDLRHCAASSAINSGVPLAAVSKLLGHGVHSQAMTARYSHVMDSELARASEAVSERLRALRDTAPAGRA